MSDVLNNVTAPDNKPTAASTIDNVGPYTRALIDVQNAAIYWQVKTGTTPGTAIWEPAAGAFMTPGSRKAPHTGPGIYGFRCWAAVPAAQLPSGSSQAQVTVQLA